LPKDVNSLRKRFAELFEEELQIEEDESKNSIPYYSDLSTNKYSVLSKEGLADEDSPFNKAIAAFIPADGDGEVFRFVDTAIKKESVPLLDDLSIYIHKIVKGSFDYKVENGTSARAHLFKQVNNYIADLYWEQAHGLKSILIPKALMSLYMDKKVNVSKKMTYNHRSLLFETLCSYNEGSNKDRMANAYCHLIKSAVERLFTLDPECLLRDLISQEKRFTPTLTMLGIRGVIPDFKIKAYKSLFLSNELENIRGSAIEAAELELGKVFKHQLTYKSLPQALNNLSALKSKVEDDLLSREIRRVRKERLLIASNLKSAHKKGKFNINRAVASQLADAKVREAFNPFRLAFAEGRIQTAPGTAINVVSYNNDKDEYYYIDNEYNNGLDKGLIKAIAIEFVAYLER